MGARRRSELRAVIAPFRGRFLSPRLRLVASQSGDGNLKFSACFVAVSCAANLLLASIHCSMNAKINEITNYATKTSADLGGRPSGELESPDRCFLLYFNFSSFGKLNFISCCSTAFTSAIHAQGERARKEAKEAIFPTVSSKLGNRRRIECFESASISSGVSADLRAE